MKRTVVPVVFPEMKGDEAAEGSFEISEPGDVVECLIQVKPRAGGVVLAQDAGRPQFDFIPTMLVSIDPDAPTRKRHFIVMPPMRVAESEGQLIYRGRFLFPDGKMQVVFEEVLETKEQSRNLLLP